MEILWNGSYLQFEWDSEKADQNLDKHDVSFSDAAEACEDPFQQLAEDDPRDYGEDRERIIGGTRKQRLLLVIYIVRGPNLRIISARQANRREREIYEQSY